MEYNGMKIPQGGASGRRAQGLLVSRRGDSGMCEAMPADNVSVATAKIGKRIVNAGFAGCKHRLT